MLRSLEEIFRCVRHAEKKTVAVAAAADLEIIEVLREAERMELADFILIGDENAIRELMAEEGLDSKAVIIHEPDDGRAAKLAVRFVREKKAHAVMKGLLHTKIFMKAVLDKGEGLHTGKLISQISVIDNRENNGLQLITDGVISIAPDLITKKQIIENAVELAHSLGCECPKVAVLGAVEVVNPAMDDTLDAAALCKMNDRGQICGCRIDGPLALDNAVSLEAARHKKIESPVAGAADILLVPDIQAGNIFIKALTYYAGRDMASVIAGTAAPVIMTSRTDSVRNKLLSLALAVYRSGEGMSSSGGG